MTFSIILEGWQENDHSEASKSYSDNSSLQNTEDNSEFQMPCNLYLWLYC